MQIRTLYKELGKLIKNGHGYKKVMIDKSSFYHPLEKSDNCVIMDVKEIVINDYPIIHSDGFIKTNLKGEEIFKKSAILKGDDF